MKFKIGDRVERIVSVDGVPEFPIGSVGVVTGVDVDGNGEPWSVDVRFDGRVNTCGCFPDSLRVISPAVEEADLSDLDLTEIL